MTTVQIGQFSVKVEHIKDTQFDITDHLQNVINFKKGDINVHSDLKKYKYFEQGLQKVESADVEKLKSMYKHTVNGDVLCLNICESSGVEDDKTPKLYISLNGEHFIYFIGLLTEKVRRGVCAQKDQVTASSDYTADFKIENEGLIIRQDMICYGLFEKGHFTQDFEQKIQYKTGEEYVGYVNENFERDQSGKYTFDGYKQVYFGDFNRGVFHGDGRLEDQNTFSIYEGTFKDGKRFGQGELRYKNLYFVGQFDGDQFEGKLETTINEEVSVEEGKYNLAEIVKKMNISELIRE